MKKKPLILFSALAVLCTTALVLTLILTRGRDSDKKGSSKTVAVGAVEITSSYELSELGEKYVVVRPDENGEYRYKIDCTVTPESATNKALYFTYDGEIDYADVSEDGLVVFDKAKVGERGLALKVTVTPKEGSDKRDSISVYAKAD